jgi:hypothetical protein
MRLLHLLLLPSLLLVACKKKEAAEPPEEPTDWNAEIADVVENDFEELCGLRSEAESEKADQPKTAIDALLAKWKAASLQEMHARTAAAKTDPKLVAALEGIYAAPGDPCARSYSVGVTTTIDDPSLKVAQGSFSFAKTLEDQAWKTGVFSSKVFASMLQPIAGPWVSLTPASEGAAGLVTLKVDFHSDGSMTVAGYTLPRLTAKGSVHFSTPNTEDLALDPVAANEGSIGYTKRTNLETGMTDTSSALDEATKAMLSDLSGQMVQQLHAKLGLYGADAQWEPFNGDWKFDDAAPPTGTCQHASMEYMLDGIESITVDATSHTVGYRGHVMPAKLVDGRVVALYRQSGECRKHRNQLDISVGVDHARAMWTIYDDKCQPCTQGVDAPVKKRS